MTQLQTTIRPRRGQRGIILVFVVVLLVLLAIMGTAYLATTRADLVTVRGRGAGLNPNTPLLNSRDTLDSAFNSIENRLKLLVAQDAQSLVDHPAQDEWMASLLPQRNAAPPGQIEWPWVSKPIAGPADSFELIDYVGDPRYPGTLVQIPTGSTGDRQNVGIDSVPLTYINRTKNNRKYPGLILPSSPAAAIIAGDPDGDGIADGYLSPIVLNPAITNVTDVNRYVDAANGVIYYYSYRIVDNSAQINLGTALSVTGDFPINYLGNANPNDNDIDTVNETREILAHNRTAGVPGRQNYGFFRSNVGMIELVQEGLSFYTGQTDPNTPAEKELRRIIDQRIPDLKKDPGVETPPTYFRSMFSKNETASTPTYVPTVIYPNGTLIASGAPTNPFYFRTLGDMLEQQAAKRPTNPEKFYMGGPLATPVLGATASPPGASDLASLHEKGGALIGPQIASSSVENAMQILLRSSTPNFASRTDNIWRWFPPDQVQLWYEWTKNLDGLHRVAPTDPAYGTNFHFTFGPSFSTDPQVALQLAGTTQVELQRSMRALFTTRNGVSSASPVRANPPPAGMPVYPAGATVNLDAVPYGEYPASKTSAATGTKRQLWRAFWSMMTAGSGAGWTEEQPNPNTTVFPAFMSASRYGPGTTTAITPKNMALIRSAIAAVNTIDLRDADDDITVLDVPLEVQDGTTLTARVYGTEKRPYITEVEWIDADGAGTASGPWLAIEIYNPHDEAIDLAAYSLGIVSRTGTTLADGAIAVVPGAYQSMTTLLGGASPLLLNPGQYAVITTEGGLPAPVGAAAPGPIAVKPMPVEGTGPAQYVRDTIPLPFAAASAGNELMLVRTRRADGNVTTDPFAGARYTEPNIATEAALTKLVPMETIDMRQVGAVGSEPTQFQYRRMSADPALTTPEAVRDRWKFVYGGQLYDVSLAAGAQGVSSVPTARPIGFPAWQKFSSLDDAANLAVPGTSADAIYGGIATPGFANHTLGEYEVAPATEQVTFGVDTPLPSKPIQIQNFTPDLTRHPADQFPFQSPFARDGDVLNVPFIGSYQIYRVVGAAYTLFEQTALPMDAFLADPIQATALANVSIGRFDPRYVHTPWAADLFDHVTARQAPAHDFLPDVPKVTMLGVTTSDYSAAGTDPLAYVGNDGPVRGTAADDPNASVPVTRVSVGGKPPVRNGEVIEDVPNVSEALSLFQGKININTAPKVVLRMLPWTVDPATGLVTDAQIAQNVTIVEEIDTARNATSFVGFDSVMDLMDPATGVGSLKTLGVPAGSDSAQMLNAGDLSGKTNKPAGDYQSEMINLNRVSNFITTRSDVYTVYFTVQAWTYRPNGQNGWNQQQDTRLVGERRGAFVVDRSQITPSGATTNLTPLLVFPIVSE